MKILDRGYWISQHFYWQSMYHYLLNGAKFRSMTYFSACNPSIDLGGMLHDRKTDIYALLPQQIVPATTIITSASATDVFIKNNNLSFPIIVKPNVGIKGFKVSKIKNQEELDLFFSENDVTQREWLLQEYLDQDKEYSVLFYRYPIERRVGISSFVEKKYPYVVGDGNATLRQLIKKYKNAFLLKSQVYKKLEKRLDEVVANGEEVILDYIGNYSRGAKFYSLMDHVDQAMADRLETLFQNAKGLNFFRVDFKANSLDDFLKGEFKILEINGMKSEPLHIYDPQSKFWGNVKILSNHWQIIADISRAQRSLSVDVPSFKHGLKSWMSIKKMTK